MFGTCSLPAQLHVIHISPVDPPYANAEPIIDPID